MQERNAIRLVRAYTKASRWQQRFMTHLNAFFNGVWLGWMDRTALDLIDEIYYEGHTDYVDDEYNLGGLQEWESEVVEEHFSDAGRVVVTAAGGGREVLALLERGFDAVGYEPNAQLAGAGARLLEQEGHGGRLKPIDRDAFPDVGPCDAVLVGWGSYMLIPGRERRIAFLRAARKRLPEGAPMLVSFFARAPEARSFVTIAFVANVVRGLLGRPRVEVGDALTPNFTHHFTQDEVTAELEAAQFQVVFYEPDPYAHLVARAV